MSTRRAADSGRQTGERSHHRAGPRWWRRARPGERLTCPRGHPFDLSVRLGNGAHACMQCDHCPPPGPPIVPCCGCWVFAVAMVGFGTILVAVDRSEVEAIDQCQTPDEVFTLLDVWPH